MSRDEATPQEEQFADLLAAFDDALAGGARPHPEGAPVELRPRLEEDLECLELLHQLRIDRAGVHPARPTASETAADPLAAPSSARYLPLRLHAVGGIGQV